jgi:hypothetical protein
VVKNLWRATHEIQNQKTNSADYFYHHYGDFGAWVNFAAVFLNRTK